MYNRGRLLHIILCLLQLKLFVLVQIFSLFIFVVGSMTIAVNDQQHVERLLPILARLKESSNNLLVCKLGP